MLLFLLLLIVGNLKYVLRLVSTISLLQFTVVPSPSTWWSSGGLDVLNCVGSYLLVTLASALLPFIATCCCSVAQCMVKHLCGSHLLGGQFWSAPVENPREMSSDCQNLGEAAAFALLHQVFTKNKWRGASEAPSRQGSTKVYLLCHLFTKPLPASLSTTFDRNNCRLIMM